MKTITTAILDTLKLGQYHPEHGGIYTGILLGDDGSTRANFVPRLTDYEPISGAWGKYGEKIEGADSYREGLANTQAMAAAGSEIAIKTLALRIGDFDDWGIATNNECRLARSNAPEAMPDGYIWTSTQYGADDAWLQYPSGSQDWHGKSLKAAVLPVRRLLVIE